MKMKTVQVLKDMCLNPQKSNTRTLCALTHTDTKEGLVKRHVLPV